MMLPSLALALALSAAPHLERLDLRRFELHYTPRAQGTASALAQVLEGERDELARRLGRDYEGTTQVLLGEGVEEVRAIAPPGVVPPPWAAALALPAQNTLLLDGRVLRGEEGKRVLRHELAHLALVRHGNGRFPRWFQEGFAMLVAGEWSLARYGALYRASLKETPLPMSALEAQWPDRLAEVELAYAQSFSFVSFIYEKGEPQFRELIAQVAAGSAFDDAYGRVFGRPLAEEEAAWRESLSARYSWVPLVTSPGALWGLVIFVFALAWLAVRRRRREKLIEMELEERAQEAALRIAAAERANAVSEDAPPEGPPPPAN